MRYVRSALVACSLSVACNGGGSEAMDASGDGSGGVVPTTTDSPATATTGAETAAAASSESMAADTSGGMDCGDVECGENEVCDPDTLECACDEGFAACDMGCCPVETGVIWDGRGAGSSIAIDDANAPHVSFLADVNVLAYAHLTPAGWEVEMLGGEKTQQRSTAIALDVEGEPLIAYRGTWSIRLARRRGDVWTDEVLYTSASGYGPQVGPRGLAVDSAGVPHVIAEQRSDSGAGSASDIWHLWWDGSAWVRESVASSNDNRYSLPSLVIDDDDALHVAWTSFFDDGLNYATRDAGGWTHAVVLDNASCCDDAVIALGPDGLPSVAYEARDLGYTIATGSDPWAIEALHDPFGLVGDIAFDASGGLVYSLTLDDLRLGRPGAAGWDVSVVMPEAQWFMMALDAEDAAHFVVQGEDAPLQYAYEPAP